MAVKEELYGRTSSGIEINVFTAESSQGISMSVIQVESFNFKGFVDATKALDTDQLVFGGLEAKLFDAGQKENSGHLPMIEEKEKYEELLITVLNQHNL